jgi:biotin transport system substrate-specific component
MSETQTVQLTMNPATVARRTVAVVVGAMLVALSAQVTVPMPGTPVPFTLQPAAVLFVAALLGPRLGAASMVLYLALGMSGMPVFTPIGFPGVARLLGPTGGYLLAYPVAAVVTGHLVGDTRSWRWVGIGLVAGMVTIHLGGVAQLAVYFRSLGAGILEGSLPFIWLDLLKVAAVGLIVRRFGRDLRALL